MVYETRDYPLRLQMLYLSTEICLGTRFQTWKEVETVFWDQLQARFQE